VSTAMASIDRLLPALFTLEEKQLLELDEATLEVSRRATSFYRRIALDSGSERVRFRGARG
jgi:hypothetical protein